MNIESMREIAKKSAIFCAVARVPSYSLEASPSRDAGRVLAVGPAAAGFLRVVGVQAYADTFFRADYPGRQTFGDARIHRAPARGLSLQGSYGRAVAP
jgi:hypothetical protein